jgi:hypothetical protein
VSSASHHINLFRLYTVTAKFFIVLGCPVELVKCPEYVISSRRKRRRPLGTAIVVPRSVIFQEKSTMFTTTTKTTTTAR